MTTTTTFAPDDPTPDRAAQLAELEYRGVRHAENLDGLKATETFYDGHIRELDATVVRLTDAVAHLPADADANEVHDAKKQLIGAELARGLAAEELGRLQVEIHDTVLAQKDNEKAVAKANAEL